MLVKVFVDVKIDEERMNIMGRDFNEEDLKNMINITYFASLLSV